jgi:hypothetical protein
MRLPSAWTERLPFLDPLEEDWLPVHRAVLIGVTALYALFLFQKAEGGGFPPLMDLVFVPIHEGGHLLFRFFGWEFLAVAGGTMLQLAVPLMLATWFIFKRQVPGTVFCMFFFFEQFLPISIYMADARAQELPLLTVGDSDYVIHDWNYMFGALGVLDHDIQIAQVARVLGWIGMFATVGWFVWRGLRSPAVAEKPQPYF